MQKVVSVVGAPDESRTARQGRFIVATSPVMPTIPFGAPMRIEVISESRAESCSHVRDAKRSRIGRISDRRGNGGSGMKPLVPCEYIPLRRGVRLCQRAPGNDNHTQHCKH